jgi:hypothetical protein
MFIRLREIDLRGIIKRNEKKAKASYRTIPYACHISPYLAGQQGCEQETPTHINHESSST